MANPPMTSVRRYGIGRGILRQDVRDFDDAEMQNSNRHPNIGHGYSMAGQSSMEDKQAETSPLTIGVAINTQFDTDKCPQNYPKRKTTVKSMYQYQSERNNATSGKGMCLFSSQLSNLTCQKVLKFLKLPDSQSVSRRLAQNIPDSKNECPPGMKTDYFLMHSLSKSEQMEFIPHIDPIMAGISFSHIRSAWNCNLSFNFQY